MKEEFLSKAVDRLKGRSYSIAEILQFLKKIGADEEEAQAVAERLLELGYLDDVILAGNIYDSCRRSKPCGSLLWREKLRERGIGPDIIESLLSGCSLQEEKESAAELAGQYLQTKAKKSPDQRLRGLAALLTRRGYSCETIELILSEVRERQGSGGTE